MRLKLKNSNKLSNKLISFLPILKSGLDELYDKLKKIEKENPFVEIKTQKTIPISNLKSAITDEIEDLTIYKKSFYEEILEEIENSYLFPTQKSKKIAYEIVKEISINGFFEGDEKEIAKKINTTPEEVEKIRKRFIYLTPNGVGAKDIFECMLFQLYNMDIPEEIFDFAKKMIYNLENIEKFNSYRYFKEAIKVIKKLRFSPNLEYMPSNEIIPEIIVINRNNNLEIRLNDEYYPQIEIVYQDLKSDFYRKKIKEAKSLIDALELRKSTIKKIALLIVEFQYEFFIGGNIKPMRIKDLAEELEYATSTISRAIADKYLLCDKGIIPLKRFFSTAIDEEISATQIKEEIKLLIKNENKDKPLSDEKLTQLINKKYNINLVRRTISKYRDSLNIPTSRERKRLYKFEIHS